MVLLAPLPDAPSRMTAVLPSTPRAGATEESDHPALQKVVPSHTEATESLAEGYVRSPFLLTTSAYHPDEPTTWPAHQHDEHELLWSDRGVITMLVQGRRWTVTPGVGLWIPAGIEHEGSASNNTAVRATYFATATWPKSWNQTATVTVNPAVRELLMHIKTTAMGDEQRMRAQQVCIDMLQVTQTAPFDVPVPQDPRLERLVTAVLKDPSDDRSLDQWADSLNITSRTLTRAFSAEVAMSFARWRRLVRMHAAIGALANGESVKVVARRVGYGSTSAFVAAFHRTVGHTPGELIELL